MVQNPLQNSEVFSVEALREALLRKQRARREATKQMKAVFSDPKATLNEL